MVSRFLLCQLSHISNRGFEFRQLISFELQTDRYENCVDVVFPSSNVANLQFKCNSLCLWGTEGGKTFQQRFRHNKM